MTWDGILEGHSDSFTECGVVGPDGSIWGSTEKFNFSKEELFKAFLSFTNSTSEKGACLSWNSQDFLIIFSNNHKMIARRHFFGVVAEKCISCFIIAFHDESIETGVCAKSVSNLANLVKNYGM